MCVEGRREGGGGGGGGGGCFGTELGSILR